MKNSKMKKSTLIFSVILVVLVIGMILLGQRLLGNTYIFHQEVNFGQKDIQKNSYFDIKNSREAEIEIITDIKGGSFEIALFSPGEKKVYQYDKLNGQDSAVIKLYKGTWHLRIMSKGSESGEYSIKMKWK